MADHVATREPADGEAHGGGEEGASAADTSESARLRTDGFVVHG
ncbi:MAG: hypothetical protein ACREQ5_19010 [Candidatus Dormibacteria bacterium]